MTTEENPNQYSPRHPHEPEVVPVYDKPGRCLICVELVLKADIERLEKDAEELASWKEVFVGYFGPEAADLLVADKSIQDAGYADIGKLQGDVERLEKERDEAVEWLQKEHSRPGSSHVPPLPGRTDYACDICRFLVGFSTVTPDCEWVYKCCGMPPYICDTHGCSWPVEGECPEAMTGNVTT